MYTALDLSLKFKYPFSEPLITVLNNAEDEARRFGQDYLGTEHLLLGLTQNNVQPLELLGIDLIKVRTAVEFIIGNGNRVEIEEIEFSPRAIKVIEVSIIAAKRYGEKSLFPTHILLGLAIQGKGFAAGVLESLGISVEKLKRQLEFKHLAEMTF